MADIVSQEKRSLMMAGIKGKNTKPEQIIRKALHAKGFRFRLHGSDLPGKPDLIFPKLNAVLFIHGCFWHGHDCHLFKMPSSRTDFWETKISRNRTLDKINFDSLQKLGWRVGVIWECSLRGRTKRTFDDSIDLTVKWLLSGAKTFTLRDKI